MKSEDLEDAGALKIVCRGCGAKFDVSEFEPFSSFDCPQCGTPLRVPKLFGKYQIEKLFGQGGMSAVYRAIDPEFSRYVAIKIMAEKAADEPALVRRFLAQARMVAQVDHPGIVPIYDSGVVGNQPFLVMKFMDSGTMESRIKQRNPAEIPSLLGMLAVVTGGLQAAMRLGIIHHDIKPGNILISSDGSAGLSDFDLAEAPAFLLDDSSRDWISPAYVSPERLLTGEEDCRGDIFSMGVTAYEAVTGQIPYATDGDAEKLLERRRHPVHLPVTDLNPALSREFSDLLDEMMAFRPEERPDYREIIAGFQQESRRLAAGGKGSPLKRFFGFGRS